MCVRKATEIIEEIKHLPDEEHSKVVEFVRRISNAETLEAMREPIDTSRSFKNSAVLFAALDVEC